MTYTKHDMKEAIIRKLRLNYGCTEQQASDGEMHEGLRHGAARHYGRARGGEPGKGRPRGAARGGFTTCPWSS